MQFVYLTVNPLTQNFTIARTNLRHYNLKISQQLCSLHPLPIQTPSFLSSGPEFPKADLSISKVKTTQPTTVNSFSGATTTFQGRRMITVALPRSFAVYTMTLIESVAQIFSTSAPLILNSTHIQNLCFLLHLFEDLCLCMFPGWTDSQLPLSH